MRSNLKRGECIITHRGDRSSASRASYRELTRVFERRAFGSW